MEDTDTLDLFPGIEQTTTPGPIDPTATPGPIDFPDIFPGVEERTETPQTPQTPLTPQTPQQHRIISRPIPITPETVRKFHIMHPSIHRAGLPSPARNNGTQRFNDAEEDSDQPTSSDTSTSEELLGGCCVRGAKNIRWSKEELQTIKEKAQKPIKYSHSIETQNNKTLEVYKSFCDQMDEELFPVTSEKGLEFMIALLDAKAYCVSTLINVIIPSLVRLSLQKTGEEIERLVVVKMKEKVREYVRRTDEDGIPLLKQPLPERWAIIPDDVSRMIQTMPRDNPQTAALASLFLFALSTGARACTCGEIRVCDIVYVSLKADQSTQVSFSLRRVKGQTRPHFITLSGFTDKYFILDVIYWINKHLQHLINISLLDLPYKELSVKQSQKKLWPYTVSQMTYFVKSRCAWAQLPPRCFSFHSFRQGFLTTAVLVYQLQGLPEVSSMITSAFLAGWKPFSKVQFGYMKNSLRSNIIATNFVGLTRTLPFSAPVSFTSPREYSCPIAINSYEFHKCVPSVKMERRLSSIAALKMEFGSRICIASASERANCAYISSSWAKACVGYAEKMKSTGKLKVCPRVYNEKRKVGLRLISEKVKANHYCILGLAEELENILESKNQLKKSLTEPLPPQEFAVGEKSSNQSAVKRRRFWSKAENKIVRKGCKYGMDVWEISLMLVIRTPLQVYDHIRALNKQRVKQGVKLLRVKRRSGKRNVRFSVTQLREMKLKMKTRRNALLAEPDSE